MITKDELNFQPLKHASFIANAVIPVNDNFSVSVSKNISDGLWYVGDDDNYEVAILCHAKPPPFIDHFADLVTLFKDSSNVTSNCNLARIQNLIDCAKELEYFGEIHVFDQNEKTTEKQWLPRFYCAKGIDFELKLEYAISIWKSAKIKILAF